MTAGPPAAGWPKLTRRSLAAHHPRGRPPSSRTTPCPKVPHSADRHPSEVLSPGVLLPTDRGGRGRGPGGLPPTVRGTTEVRDRALGELAGWETDPPGGVLTSAYLAAHSNLKATYARLSRSSQERPLGRINPQAAKGAPRACGGGPHLGAAVDGVGECSPRVRGWSPSHGVGLGAGAVLPARAGVVPWSPNRPWTCRRAPRACGGGPIGFFGQLPMRRCSPRVRGWSRGQRDDQVAEGVLPARARAPPPHPPPDSTQPGPLPHRDTHAHAPHPPGNTAGRVPYGLRS